MLGDEELGGKDTLGAGISAPIVGEGAAKRVDVGVEMGEEVAGEMGGSGNDRRATGADGWEA